MNATIRIISLFIIGTIPILFAAVEPWVWSVYALLMIFLYILSLWIMPDPFTLLRISGLKTTLGVFFIWTLCLFSLFLQFKNSYTYL